jgi:drug/metabolite transporter (DMT)-like permease
MAIALAGFAALFYGIADFSGGFAAARSRVVAVLFYSQLLGLALALAALAVLGPGLPPVRDLGWGFLAGVAGSLGLFMLYGGIARSIVAIVSPASAVVGALLPVLFALVLGERPSGFALAGAALCLPAIFMLAWEGGANGAGRAAIKTALGYGVLAGLGFGVFFAALSRCSPAAGLWPLVAARAASLSGCLLASLIARHPLRLERPARWPAMGAGLADMGANILFLLASQCGLLSLVAIVTSLFPAPTVLLARIFLRQRIPPVRFAGFVLALAGVGLISLR